MTKNITQPYPETVYLVDILMINEHLFN